MSSGDELMEVSEAYMRISAQLSAERLRADMWKMTALAMREHTSVVGIRKLREAIAEEAEIWAPRTGG